MELWIVGKKIEDHECAWLFEGVFDSEEKAIKACKEDSYFIAPSELNYSHPDAPAWKGSYYPLLETKEEGASRLAQISGK